MAGKQGWERRMYQKRKPNLAAVLKISFGGPWGGGGYNSKAYLLRPRLQHSPHNKEGRRRGFGGVAQPLVKRSKPHPPLHKLAQLQTPHSWEGHIHRTLTWEPAGRGCHHPSKTPKVLPRLIAEALYHSTARDTKRCNRSRICWKRLCQTCPSPVEVPQLVQM